MNLIERVQYKAGLIVSGCWQGTNREKLLSELGWESLSDRRWLRRLCLFFRIFRHETPQYLADHLPVPREIQYDIRNARVFDLPASRTARFSSSFFPYCASEWESLSDEIKSSSTLRQIQK